MRYPKDAHLRRRPRVSLVAAAAVTVAAAVVVAASSSGDTGTGPTPALGPNTNDVPIATGPMSSDLDHIEWVISGYAMSRGEAGETYSVECVPAGELHLDPAQQTHFREVQTDADTSYAAVDGGPCPAGPILTEW